MISPYLPQPPRLDDTPIVRYLVEIWKKLGRKGAILGSLKFGNDASNSEFEDDGTLVFNGDATVWNDINLPAANLRPGATPPNWANVFASGGIYGYTFNPSIANDELHSSGEILHDYKEGTDLHLHVHWMATTANAGVVRWGLEYVWCNVGDTSAAPATIYVNATASGTAWKHQLTSFPTISGTGKHIGSMFAFRIFRAATDAADTYPDTAYLPQVGIHYEIDTVGSREMTTK